MDTAFVAGEHVVAGTRAVQAGPVVTAAGGARQPVAVFAQTQAPAFVAVAVAVGAVAGPVATATVAAGRQQQRGHRVQRQGTGALFLFARDAPPPRQTGAFTGAGLALAVVGTGVVGSCKCGKSGVQGAMLQFTTGAKEIVKALAHVGGTAML